MRREESPRWIGCNRRAVGIVRVSNIRQLDGNSPTTQRKGITAYAADVGIQLARIEEFHESAKRSKDRIKFHALIERARSEGIRHLVYFVWDRTTRNFTDHEWLEELIRDDVFVLHVAHDNRVLHKDSPDSDWLSADFNTLTAKQYSRDLRRRANESMRTKAETGWYPTRPPIGYVNQKLMGDDGQIKERGGIIALTDWGRVLVRRMGELRLACVSLDGIAESVLGEGLVPARKQWRFKGNGRRSGVERILKDVFYRGDFQWGGKLYRGNHAPVFTREEWEAIQEAGRERPPQQKRKHEGLFGRPPLRLRCADPRCGCVVVYAPKLKNGVAYRYYRCTNGKRVHVGEQNITEDAIMAQLSSAVDAIAITEDLATAIAHALGETHRKAQAAKDREVEGYRRQVAELEAKEDALVDLRLARGLDDEAFRRQLDRIRRDRDRAFDALQQAQRQVDGAYLVTAQRTLELAKNAKRLWEARTREERRDLLAKLLWNPVLEGRSVRFDLRKPFRILAEMRQSEDWRGGRDLNPRPPA